MQPDQSVNILLVDDHPGNLLALEAILNPLGHNLVKATSGEEALKRLLQHDFAAILLDVHMPVMDGFSLVHRLRLNPQTRDIPVIFLSATYVTPEDKDFALTIGVTRFVEKPVNLESFLPMLDEFLSGGTTNSHQPVNERDFYEGYRKRLQAKLKQKNLQITRDTHLLESLSETERPSFEASLHQMIHERDEIEKLLEKIQQQLDNHTNTE